MREKKHDSKNSSTVEPNAKAGGKLFFTKFINTAWIVICQEYFNLDLGIRFSGLSGLSNCISLGFSGISLWEKAWDSVHSMWIYKAFCALVERGFQSCVTRPFQRFASFFSLTALLILVLSQSLFWPWNQDIVSIWSWSWDTEGDIMAILNASKTYTGNPHLTTTVGIDNPITKQCSHYLKHHMATTGLKWQFLCGINWITQVVKWDTTEPYLMILLPSSPLEKLVRSLLVVKWLSGDLMTVGILWQL